MEKGKTVHSKLTGFDVGAIETKNTSRNMGEKNLYLNLKSLLKRTNHKRLTE